MARLRPLILIGAVLLLMFAILGAGVWWYLYGANSVAAAELVPADTIAFATIPNGAALAGGYETSNLKSLVESPNSKPIFDWARGLLGQKTLDVLTAFAPNLSGQSFIAVTHYDPAHPEQAGLIAAMKPKPGFGNFDSFVNQLKASWPDTFKQGTTGTATVAGFNYRWAQGPGATDKICVAQIGGWTVTSWGEAGLQDWIERYQKKSATPSLAAKPEYQKSLARVGPAPLTLVYIDTATLAKTFRPANSKDTSAMGPLTASARFENGEIVDRLSFLAPQPTRADSGMNAVPCSFETLKFTGPDTRLYWAMSIDWKQFYTHYLAEHTSAATPAKSAADEWITAAQNWAQSAGLDVQKNIIDPLGSELSIQAEWSADTTYPSLGLFVKLDKPDDFQPTIKAIIESVHQKYATSAVVEELASGGHKFAGLKFMQSSVFSPAITEDGDYLGVFLTENQAVRSFQRDESLSLTRNPDFTRQLGDKRGGASQLLFLDAPRLLNRAYLSVAPYLSLASMFNKDLAALLKGRDMPQDLTWLAPMGTWAFAVTPDHDGVMAYSASGIGNQGILLGAGFSSTYSTLQRLGFLPNSKPNSSAAPAAMPTPPTAATTNVPATSPPDATPSPAPH